MIYTLTGANSHSLQSQLRELTAAFIAAEGDLALERLDGTEVTIERLGEALTSLPFLSTHKMVQIRQGSANKQFTEQIETLLGGIPDTTTVILIEPKLDKRSGYYKYLKKATDYQEYNELDPHGLARWLQQAAQQQKGSLGPADAAYLVNRVGANQQLLSQELAKLLLYNPQIDRQTIDLLTESTPQSTVFELLEATFGGHTERALALYAEQRALKVEPQQIVAMLAWQLHILALIKTAGSRSPETIASEAKLSPYVVKKSLGITQKVTLNQLKRYITDLTTIDIRSKREAFSIDEALQYYLVALSMSDQKVLGRSLEDNTKLAVFL